jgi:predicted TIM-barrel fold metal-dependent hydrolase
MIIDAHVKIGPSFDKKGRFIEEYLELMKTNGIDQALLCPNRPSSYSFAEGNAYVAGILSKYPGLFMGAVRVDVWNFSKSETDIYFKNDDFQALYLNPWEDTFRCNDEITFPVYEYAREKGLPVIIEAGYPFVSHISQIGYIAGKYPQVKFLATNAAQLDLSGFTLSDVSFVLSNHDNIYLGTAAAVGAEWLENQVCRNAKGRVLFESGYPFFDVRMEVFRIEYAYFTQEKKEVFCENLLEFIKVPK